MVEKIRLISEDERIQKVQEAGYNLFFVNAKDVYIDLLTDSGTGAMSQEQWAALMMADESYGSPESFIRMRRAIFIHLGFPFVIGAHQGRGAEKVVNEALMKRGMVVPGNAHFDTTRAHIEKVGGIPLDCTVDEAYDMSSMYEFKGNLDISKLETVLQKYEKKVPYILITITCNSVGGQPVSMNNIKLAAVLAKKYCVPLFFDGARFAENAYFIKKNELPNKSIKEIVLEMMSYADAMLMSAKKDAIVNMGGFIAVRSEKLYNKLLPISVINEGGPGYGGMSGRTMEALAVGLGEGIDEDYLSHRVEQVAYLGEKLHKLEVPVIRPFGGHAVYVDAGDFLPNIPPPEFPGHALAVELYIKGGIRSVEIGSLMQGNGAKIELLRLALPWRVYGREHLDFVAEIFKKIIPKKDKLGGYEFISDTKVLRHFTSRLRPVAKKQGAEC